MQPSPSIDYFIEQNLYVEAQTTIGKRIVILAEAESGPLYEPVLVYHKDMAYNFFGSGRLPQMYEEATTFQENLDIYLMRIETLDYKTAFMVLEAMPFDLMFIDGLHFDTDLETVKELLAIAESKQELGNLVHLITTLSRPHTYAELNVLTESIQALSVEEGDEVFEIGKHLSIVTDQMGELNAGAVYAGMLATLDPEISPINKEIPSVSLAMEFSNEEILNLRAGGIVCFKNTFKNGVTCSSSSCAVSTPGSVHKHISNFRIAQSLINQISLELQPFIGRTNLQFQALNIEDILLAICEEAVVDRRIRYYEYGLSVNEAKGYIDVGIELVPIFSVHGMTARSRMRVFK